MTEPARHLVKAGDYIVECNGKKIADKKRLQDTLKKLDAEEVVLKLRRDSGYLDVKIKPVRNKKNQYMLGIWVRDNAQGLGTVTFLNTDSRFGALGHGIHDTDTNTLMEIKDGRVYETSIRSIQKGAGGEPGGIEGIMFWELLIKIQIVGYSEPLNVQTTCSGIQSRSALWQRMRSKKGMRLYDAV